MAARLNFRLQACVVRRRFTHRSRHDSPLFTQFAGLDGSDDLMERSPDDRAQELARALAKIRPELDLYLMTEISVEDLAGLSHHFRRIFHAREGSLELHLSILDGVAARYRAPFFSALRSYSHRPTGVFHALPISHGKSIVNSHWIRDMIDFYGRTSSWPRPRRPAAGWTRCWSRPGRCGRRRNWRPYVRVAADVLCHQRDLHGEQDRGAGAGAAGGHRAGGPELPPVSSLRADAGRGEGDLPGGLPAE